MSKDALWVLPNGTTKVVLLDDDGNLIPDPSEPFGGKGDHDGDGKMGGAKPAQDKPRKKRI